MLNELSIRDIVLIDKLTLSFTGGLNVLTGETGAGKSILLDSLGLALGARAERALVRSGCERGAVTASFSLPKEHPVCALLEERFIDSEDGQLVLRRQVSADGRSKAWVNDEPVSRGLLAEIALMLVEIHGQHDDRGLLDAGAHRQLLDDFAGVGTEKKRVAETYQALQEARQQETQIREDMRKAQEDEEYVRHAFGELDALSPALNEEEELADRRALMMQGEKAAQELAEFQDVLNANEGVDAKVRGVLRRMDRLGEELASVLSPAAEALDRAAEELAIADQELSRILDGLSFNPSELEQVEERLFEYRRLARKHACQPDDLVTLMEQFSHQIASIDGGTERLDAAVKAVAAASGKFTSAVQALGKKRTSSAKALDALVNAELSPLKLEKATFRTSIETLPEEEWGASGGEKVLFEVKTNAGSDLGRMLKVVLGGELAAFILLSKFGCQKIPV